MQLTVTGRQLALTDDIQKQIARKLSRIERRLNANAVSAQCVLSRERERVVCELTVHARGDHMLVGVGRHVGLAGAVTAAVDKVLRQAQTLAGKWKTRRRRSARPASPEAVPAARSPRPRVIRARRYAVRTMTVDDAALELAKGDAAFLVFRQPASETVAVVFRRPDGHVGLIDPEA